MNTLKIPFLYRNQSILFNSDLYQLKFIFLFIFTGHTSRGVSGVSGVNVEQEISRLRLREQKRKLEMMEEAHMAKMKVIRLDEQ